MVHFHAKSKEGVLMRLMMKFTLPVERGNEAAKDGTIGRAIEKIAKKF